MNEVSDISECVELLEQATPQLYRRNLFRVLGLPVTATPADVRRQQKRLEMQRKLGVASSDGNEGPLALVPPPADEDLRAAMDRLNDPEARLLDEVFWFWPLDGNPAADAGLQALDQGQVKEASEIWLKQVKANGHGQIATHNLAVLDHLAALDFEARLASGSLDAKQKARLAELWSQALGRWGEVLDGEDFWSRVKDRVREINDAKLTTGLVRRMRNTLPKALLLINATMAYGAAERKDGDGTQRHVRIVREAKFPDGLADGALREALQPIRNRLKLICEDAKKQAEQNRDGAAQIARDVAEKTRPLLDVVDQMLPTDDPTCRGMHDDVALAMDLCCGFHWNTAKDSVVTAELLELTLAIASGDSLRERLTKELKDFRELVELTQCFFCGRSIPDEDCAINVTMTGDHKSTQYGNTIHRTWNERKVKVPRCKACKEAHVVAVRKGNRAGWPVLLKWLLATEAVFQAAVWIIGGIQATPSDTLGAISFLGGVFPGGIFLILPAAFLASRKAKQVERAALGKVRPACDYKEHSFVTSRLTGDWTADATVERVQW